MKKAKKDFLNRQFAPHTRRAPGSNAPHPVLPGCRRLRNLVKFLAGFSVCLLGQHVLQDLQSFFQLRIRDHQRNQVADHVSEGTGRKENEPFIVAAFDDGFGKSLLGFGFFLSRTISRAFMAPRPRASPM